MTNFTLLQAFAFAHAALRPCQPQTVQQFLIMNAAQGAALDEQERTGLTFARHSMPQRWGSGSQTSSHPHRR